MVGGLAALLAAVDDTGTTGGTNPDDLSEAWAVSSYDMSSDYGTFGAVDGTHDGWVLTSSTGWVAMTEPSTPNARLMSLDPDDGAVQWSRDLPESRCSQVAEEELVCLTRPEGSGFELVRVAAGDGALVGDAVPVALSHVPYLITPLAEGLLVLSADRSLAAVGLDGSIGWTEPVAIPSDVDLGYLEIDSAHYPEATLLHLGWTIGTVHATTDGMSMAACRAVAATPEAWVCESDDETVARAPDGTELWSGDWDDYYLVDGYQRIAPVLVVDNWDGTVSMVDAASGDRGAPLLVASDSQHMNLLGDAEHPVIATEDAVALLDPAGTSVLWQTALTDEFLNIAVGVVVGDVLVMDAANSYGLDLAGGELLWTRDFLATGTYGRDDALVGADWGEIVRYRLP